ncbi:MAG TPA: ABC transporter substrate-binding protein [Devosiaceae bacterium]|nr:ABC transporter substrate-binding protein [Devosiaceae bacterium]
MRGLLRTAAAATALLTISVFSAAQAADTLVWWDFLGGGDGVRMKALIDEFNKEHAGKIQIEATTLDWGTPFYTKVQTSTAVGQGPDIMTYHESRIPLGISTGSLSVITPEEMAASEIKASDFEPADWKAAQDADGKQYAIPLDIHSAILYYNKTLLKQAGLLGDDGKPKGFDGIANWDAALAKLTANGVSGLTFPTADNASTWRVFYTLLNQEDGVFFKDGKFLDGDNLDKATTAIAEMQKWVKNGWTPKQTEYAGSIAQFTSGKAAMMINGVWEVPTMVDLQKKGQLFDWGAIQIPTLYAHAATWADSHSFAIPDRKGNPLTPAKRKEVLDTIHWFNEHSLEWAGGGHLPAFNPVRDSDAFKNLKPNSDYASLAATAVFDPVTPLAGVASPVYDAAGNYAMPAVNGEMDPADAASQMRDDLQGQVQ